MKDFLFFENANMKSQSKLTIIELVIGICILLVIASMFMPFLQISTDCSVRNKDKATIKSIGLIMVAYAEDDIRSFKMPYPLPKGKEKVWGNSKDCWSTSIAEMLFRQKYMRKGEESQLQCRGLQGKNYIPMFLDDNTIDQDKYWAKQTPLDFQIFCDKDLTSNVSGKLILVATYDNDDIRNCQNGGTGWIVFYADKTVEFIKRKNFKGIENENKQFPNYSINAIEGAINGKDIVLRKDIPESEGGPGNFGHMLGGGSTELMGKSDTSAIYKQLVEKKSLWSSD
jgi:hypothetical protein